MSEKITRENILQKLKLHLKEQTPEVCLVAGQLIEKLESSVAFYERECKRWSDLYVESHVYEKRIVELEADNSRLRELLSSLASAAKAYGEAEYFDDDEAIEGCGHILIDAIEAMMNKKEQAAFADLQEQLRIAKALRFTEPVERDLPPPESGSSNKLTKGFDYNAYISGTRGPRVERACSSCVGHAFGQDDKTTTQNPRHIFSTKLLALKAMRNDVELQVAKILADIDLTIEQEKPHENQSC